MLAHKITRKFLPQLLVLLLIPAVGCGPKNAYFEDDEGGTRQNDIVGGEHPDSLSRPYAIGTKVKITVRSAANQPTSSWQVKSDNPAVFLVDKLSATDNKYITAECTAVGNGDTTLHAIDEAGVDQRTAQISVGTPDRMRVLAHGLLRVLGQTEAAAAGAEVTQAYVLNGSTGAYAILYYRGNERLYGRGIVQFDPVTQLTTTNQVTSGGPINEWLFIKPLATGSFVLNLRRGSTLLALPVSSVADTDLTSITLQQEQVDGPAQDQAIWVLVQAMDRNNNKVQGVYSTFTLGGAAQVGSGNNTSVTMGDLYRFNYAAGMNQDLIAKHGTLSATLSIPASKGYVADTTYLGCEAMPGRRGGAGALALIFIAAAMLALGISRRRLRAI